MTDGRGRGGQSSGLFTVVQSKDCSRSRKSTKKLSDDVEGKLPNLQFAQNHHGQGHSGVHVPPWDQRQSRDVKSGAVGGGESAVTSSPSLGRLSHARGGAAEGERPVLLYVDDVCSRAE